MEYKKRNTYGSVYECPKEGCTETHQDYDYKKVEQKRCPTHSSVLDTNGKCQDCIYESCW